MIKRKAIIAAMLTASIQHGVAQTSIADVWKSMPDSIIPILNSNARNEILEMSKFGSAVTTKNLLGGDCKLITMTKNMIDVRLTEKTGVQLLTLEKADSTKLICMNKYFGSPAIDSDVTFYTEDWKKDASISIPSICADEYFSSCSVSAAKDSCDSEYEFAILPPVTTAICLSDKDGGEILLTANAPLYVSTEKNENKRPKLQKSLKWNGITFK